MGKTRNQIIRNALTGWGVVGVRGAVGLIMVPFLLRHLGKDGYGAAGIITAIIGFAGIADIGLRAALNRQLSEKVATHDREGFRQLSVSALILYLVIALIIGGVLALFAVDLCVLFNVTEEYSSLMVILLRTYAPLTILVSFMTPVFTAGMASFLRYDVENNIATVSTLCINLALFAAITLVPSAPLVVWCSVLGIGAVIRFAVMAVFYRRICYSGILSLRYLHFQSLLPLFRLGGSMYVIQLCNILSQQMDTLIISRFLGLGSVAIYRAGTTLPALVKPIVFTVTRQLTPLTTKYHVTQDTKREQQVLILGTKYTLYLGSLFSAGMFVFAAPFCHLWLFNELGNDVKTVALVLKMWALIGFFNYAAGPQWPIVLGKNKIKFSVWLSVATSLFNVVLSVYLVGYARMGVGGVLVGTLITEIVRRPIAAWYVSRISGMKLSHYVVRSYVAPVAYMVVLSLSAYLLELHDPADTWWELIVSSLMVGFWALVLFLAFEWRLLRQYVLHARQPISLWFQKH